MLLTILLLLPLVSILIITLIPKYNIILIKQLSLSFSSFIFFFNIIIYIKFDIYSSSYQFIENIFYFDGINYTIGIDGISIFFILLTTFLMPVCFLVNWGSVKYRSKDFILILFILEYFLINVFLSIDLFFFYIFFEAVLIPMFIMIGLWGSRERKIHASYQFFIYTFIGSVIMLLCIFLIYLHVGSTNLDLITNSTFSEHRQLILWFGIFFALATKVPVYPVHIWLPEAHVEAPTSGSILLAGILLKLGTYGFIRFLIPLFPYALIYFTPLVFTIALISIIYGSFATIRQIDLKKIIAYSSIVHMNLSILGLFTHTLEGMQGSIYLMLSHGIVSGALFLAIGVLYDRYHTRVILYYGGLVSFMPLFSIIFLIFILSNIGFPGTSSFVGEFLVLLSILELNIKVGILAGVSMVLSAIYSVWLYNRIIFSELRFFNIIKNKILFYNYWFIKFADLTKREFFLFAPLICINIFLGIYPDCILSFTYLSIVHLI